MVQNLVSGIGFLNHASQMLNFINLWEHGWCVPLVKCPSFPNRLSFKSKLAEEKVRTRWEFFFFDCSLKIQTSCTPQLAIEFTINYRWVSRRIHCPIRYNTSRPNVFTVHSLAVVINTAISDGFLCLEVCKTDWRVKKKNVRKTFLRKRYTKSSCKPNCELMK